MNRKHFLQTLAAAVAGVFVCRPKKVPPYRPARNYPVQTALSVWEQAVQNEIRRRRLDPDFIHAFPFPVTHVEFHEPLILS